MTSNPVSRGNPRNEVRGDGRPLAVALALALGVGFALTAAGCKGKADDLRGADFGGGGGGEGSTGKARAASVPSGNPGAAGEARAPAAPTAGPAAQGVPATLAAAWSGQRTGAAAVLPGIGEVGDRVPTSPPEVFPVERLTEAIDGAAPSYERHGCREMARAEYRPGEGAAFPEDVSVEVYRMATEKGARGRFEEERDGCLPSSPPGGCLRGADLVLAAGPYFIRITTFANTEAGQRELLAFAAAMIPKAR